jgi:hypothetical protein
MAHEKSITIQSGKKWVNIPTVIGGKQVNNGDAVGAFNDGKIRALGGVEFDTMKKAVAAAKKRSSSVSSFLREAAEPEE